jgi:16S rRNA processing protein RimM
VKENWYVIEKSAIHKGRPLLKLSGIGSVELAEGLKWEKMSAAGEPELDDDEYLVSDLIGLQVITDEGLQLGKIDEILPYPAHDILVIGEVMIPLIKEFVKEIDPESNTVTVHLIPGMVSD